ncbi:hemin-degrading factor [Tranquillimonas rosea]|uniref:hemin-degrading factor n=1 Tax=Tranquillimonas rosea TaxID=641238 RepID=UPI003BAAD0F0
MSANLTAPPSAAALRVAAAEATLRPRDLAASLGVSEAQLLAAQSDGGDVTPIAAHPDALVAELSSLGEMMALTRNESIVSEVHGTYDGYASGGHACLVLGAGIDLRLFPKHWCHAFAVEAETAQGVRRSFQVFDAAGDAVHKAYLPLDADPAGWQALRDRLALTEPSDTLEVAPRAPAEGAIVAPEKAAALRKGWDDLGDTHQFLALTRKLRINRLGAYRIAGAPYARALAPEALSEALHRVAGTGVSTMIFVGNPGCIQIHSGPIGPIRPMGPWLNVLDPGFDMHLRGDHVAEVWAVSKPTRRGPALSLEAFDADGRLIAQIFGHRAAERDETGPWAELLDALPDRAVEGA